jgi:thiamine kinase-like enzyme
MKKITVVFPMAGEGQRFGNKFKPFLKIFNKTFIEMAIEPFLKHKDEIKRIIFIIREDHAKQFDVIGKLAEFNTSIQSSVILIEPTKNVIETISPLFDDHKFIRDVIFCDCDHWLNVDEIFRQIQKDEFDCIIPGWDISDKESKNWSIASVGNNNMVFDIKEKEYPLPSDKFYGIIGCYYFRKLNHPSDIFTHFSGIISYMMPGNRVKLIPIKEAEFFGDPQRLENLYISKNASTIFCDLDGTVIKHENIPDYTRGMELLPGAKEKIEQWRKDNAFIVFTTSRDEQYRTEMEKMLRYAGIIYEYLVMGLPPGPRYLINDKKPYSDKEMAKAFEVERDKGIASIGHSFAILKFGAKGMIGYKSIPKDAPQHQKDKFKAQFETMSSILSDHELFDLVPAIGGFTGDKYMIEYLMDYKGLHQFSIYDRLIIFNNLFENLTKLYLQKKEILISWLGDFIENKILAKYKDLAELGLSTDLLTRIAEIYRDHINELNPTFLCQYFHGDLTYENIMVKNDDIKLIDFDNDNLPGPPELDLGKLMQSILTSYEHWDNPDFIIEPEMSEFNAVIDFYSELLGQSKEQVIKKAYFYCALHLIRMIPYQANTSIERAKKTLWWAEKIIEKYGTF